LVEIEAIVPLFDAYRQFYGKPSEPEACRTFLLERFKYNQSAIFLVQDWREVAVGDHMVFTRPRVLRPVVIPKYQSIPVFIIKNNLRTAGISRERYFERLKECQ
jgi:hypothetical protein